MRLDILIKDIIANLSVTLPVGWIAKVIIKKYIDGIGEKQNATDIAVASLRNDLENRYTQFERGVEKVADRIVGIPLHNSEMDSHVRRMNTLEREMKESHENTAHIIRIMGDIVDRKADASVVDMILRDVQIIKEDVVNVKGMMNQWKTS